MSTADERQASFELAYRTLTSVWPSGWSLADLQQHLGGIPAERIRLVPPRATLPSRISWKSRSRKIGSTN